MKKVIITPLPPNTRLEVGMHCRNRIGHIWLLESEESEKRARDTHFEPVKVEIERIVFEPIMRHGRHIQGCPEEDEFVASETGSLISAPSGNRGYLYTRRVDPVTAGEETPKPCPFCGSTDVHSDGLSVNCDGCCTCGPDGESRQDSIVRWNKAPRA